MLFRSRNPKQNDMYCLEVSSGLRKIIMKTKRIFIDWNSCRIEDSLPIIRCYKCHGFGHKSNDCKQTDEKCGHCSQSHESKSCQASSDQLLCPNCLTYNSNPNQKIKYKTNHSAYHKSCQSFIRIQELVKSRIDYD